MSFRVDHAHNLPLEEARERVRALGEYLNNKHGIGVTWTAENEARVKGKFLVVTIDGVMKVSSTGVSIEGKDPGMLWRGKAKDYLGHKLQRYLDTKTPLGDLPRR
jgi:hypothetical protein